MKFVTVLFVAIATIATAVSFLPSGTAPVSLLQAAFAADTFALPGAVHTISALAAALKAARSAVPPGSPTKRAAPTRGAPARRAASTATPTVATATTGPTLTYWWNNSQQSVNQSICNINLIPSIMFYVSYYCNGNCPTNSPGNPYRWTIWLYGPNNNLIGFLPQQQLSSDWINWSFTIPAPLTAGTYHGVLTLEVRHLIGGWYTKVNAANTNSVTFTNPANPIGQAPVPDLRLEVVANSTTASNYRLRGWQVGGSPALQPQWNLYNSDQSGAELGPAVSITWSPMGSSHVIPFDLNAGSWYMLKYGNYSACYSWNETRRKIYIGP